MKEQVKALNDLMLALNFDREAIGVKFIFSKKEFDDIEAKQPTQIYYCSMVSQASNGSVLKASLENFYCGAAARVLGLTKPTSEVISGQSYYEILRMYNSLGTAKQVHGNVTYINHEIYGVLVKPLKSFIEEPDVIIIICNPYNSMRMLQGYVYHYGKPKNIKMMGNQGICSECTATPYETNDLNVSLMCSNTRFAAKWEDHELALGIPFNMFTNVVDGLMKSMNTAEPDNKKYEILKRAEEENRRVDIEIGDNYWSRIAEKKKAK